MFVCLNDSIVSFDIRSSGTFSNLNNLRSHLEHYQRHKVFHNIVMVGNAFNLVDTGIPDSFNVVNVTRMLDVDSVGDLLQTAGFVHWEKITNTFLTALSDTAELPPSTQPIRSFLATARVLEAVVADAIVHLSLVSFGGAGSSDGESYTVERTCFIRALLEYTHKFGRNIPDVGSDVVKSFSDCVLLLFNEQQRVSPSHPLFPKSPSHPQIKHNTYNTKIHPMFLK